jgi:hypothetical protein
LSQQIPLGSSYTNFWLLYTFKVQNIVFLGQFSFWLVDLVFRYIFQDFESRLQIPSGSPHTNFWLLYTFKVLNILFLGTFSFWLVDLMFRQFFFKILGRAYKLRRVAPIRSFGSFSFLRYYKYFFWIFFVLIGRFGVLIIC